MGLASSRKCKRWTARTWERKRGSSEAGLDDIDDDVDGDVDVNDANDDDVDDDDGDTRRERNRSSRSSNCRDDALPRSYFGDENAELAATTETPTPSLSAFSSAFGSSAYDDDNDVADDDDDDVGDDDNDDDALATMRPPSHSAAISPRKICHVRGSTRRGGE